VVERPLAKKLEVLLKKGLYDLAHRVVQAGGEVVEEGGKRGGVEAPRRCGKLYGPSTGTTSTSEWTMNGTSCLYSVVSVLA